MIKKDKKGEKLIHVKSYEDFLKIKDLDKKVFHTVIFIIDNDIDLAGIEITPIDASGINVVINGQEGKEKDKTGLHDRRSVLRNMSIDNGNNLETGLFAKTKDFSAINVHMCNYTVKGGSCTGVLVGSVDGNAKVKNCGFVGNVYAEAYCGGLFGTVKNLEMDDVIVLGDIKGKDIIGGVAGVVDSVKSVSTHVGARIHSAHGKAIGQIAGYNGEEMAPTVEYLSKVAMETVKPKPTPEEMEIIELIIRK